MKNIKTFQQFNESIDAKRKAYSFIVNLTVTADNISDAEDKASTLEFEGVDIGFLDLKSESNGVFIFKTEVTLNSKSKIEAEQYLNRLSVNFVSIEVVEFLYDNEHLVKEGELVEEGFFSGHDPVKDLEKNYNIYVSQSKRDPKYKDLTKDDFEKAKDLCFSTKCKATKFESDSIKLAYEYLLKRCSKIEKEHTKQGNSSFGGGLF